MLDQSEPIKIDQQAPRRLPPFHHLPNDSDLENDHREDGDHRVQIGVPGGRRHAKSVPEVYLDIVI